MEVLHSNGPAAVGLDWANELHSPRANFAADRNSFARLHNVAASCCRPSQRLYGERVGLAMAVVDDDDDDAPVVRAAACFHDGGGPV